LITGDEDGNVQVWDISKKKMICSIPTGVGWCWDICFGANGKVYCGHSNGYISEIDIENREVIKGFQAYNYSDAWNVKLSHDLNSLYTLNHGKGGSLHQYDVSEELKQKSEKKFGKVGLCPYMLVLDRDERFALIGDCGGS